MSQSILRGLWRLATGRKSGIEDFGSTTNAFTASIAPLIAFPIVGDALLAMDGHWQLAATGFLSRLCAVLAMPVIIHAYAQRAQREPLWLRTATALNWSFWLLPPLLLIAAFISAALVSLGTQENGAKYAVFGIIIIAYMLWFQIFTVKTGLQLHVAPALGLVIVADLLIAALSLAPELLTHG